MIIVDDQPYEQGCAGATLRQLTRQLNTRNDQGGPRMVVAVYLNGQAVEGPELNALLDSPASSEHQLELVTQPVSGLVRAALEHGIELLDQADGIRDQAADLLDAGDQSSAMQQIQDLLALWQEVQKTLVLSTEALGLRLDDLSVDGRSFVELVEAMKNWLSELRTAMANRDHVAVSDMLRYEAEETLRHWRSLLATLRDSLAPV